MLARHPPTLKTHYASQHSPTKPYTPHLFSLLILFFLVEMLCPLIFAIKSCQREEKNRARICLCAGYTCQPGAKHRWEAWHQNQVCEYGGQTLNLLRDDNGESMAAHGYSKHCSLVSDRNPTVFQRTKERNSQPSDMPMMDSAHFLVKESCSP